MAIHKKTKTSSSRYYNDISPRQRGQFTEHGSSFDRNEENFSASINDLERNGSANRYEADRFELGVDSRSSRTRGMNEEDYEDHEDDGPRSAHGLEVEDDEQEDGFLGNTASQRPRES